MISESKVPTEQSRWEAHRGSINRGDCLEIQFAKRGVEENLQGQTFRTEVTIVAEHVTSLPENAQSGRSTKTAQHCDSLLHTAEHHILFCCHLSNRRWIVLFEHLGTISYWFGIMRNFSTITRLGCVVRWTDFCDTQFNIRGESIVRSRTIAVLYLTCDSSKRFSCFLCHLALIKEMLSQCPHMRLAWISSS